MAHKWQSEVSNLGHCTAEPIILQDPTLNRYLKILVHDFAEEH